MTETEKERFSEALARLSGDEEMLVMLAGIAAEDGPPMLSQMDRQVSGGDLAAFAKTAHAFKGLLSTFETDEPVSELQSVIDAARQGDEPTVKVMHGKLLPELEKLSAEVRTLASRQ